MDSITNDLRFYISQAEKLLSQGLFPAPPETLEQLDWLIDEPPNYARPYLPSPSTMQQLGRHSQYGRLEELPELFRERFLLTILNDPQFGSAISVALRMEGNQ